MPSQILSGQSACTFPTPRVSDSGSLLAGLHFLYGGFHWEKYADPCRRYHRRLVLGGILYRVPADSHSGGGDLRCLHRLIKRETTKAIHAVVNFVVVFVLSAAFIAYAPDYIGKINEFSADISNASLTLGTKIVLPNSESQGKDSVDLIRTACFPFRSSSRGSCCNTATRMWKALGLTVWNACSQPVQTKTTGRTGKKSCGGNRRQGKYQPYHHKDHQPLGNRLLPVHVQYRYLRFCIPAHGIMIFSQVLFIIYAMFLPVSFLLSMVPSFEGMSKRAITKLFNTILTRAGITLIITVAFSISTMLYNLSGEYPFFLTAFLQIVTFAGIYFKLGI